MSVSDLGRLSSEGNAVYTWFSRLWFFTQAGVEITLDDLSNGHRVWEALQVINPDHFRGDLPDGAQSAGRWVNNLQNLKRIYTPLRHYVVEATRDSLPEGPGEIDIKAIAEGSHDEELIKMLKWVLISAVNSEGNAPFISEIGEMAHELQAHLANVINAFTSSSNQPQPTSDTVEQPLSSPTKVSVDNDLYNEQMYGDLAARNSKLEKEKKDLQRELRILEQRNERLKGNNDELIRELREAQDEAKKSSAELDGQQNIRVLESRLQEANGWIDDVERKHAEAQATISRMQLVEGQLRKENERLQPLMDSIDTMKKDRETLARKANMVDKLKQKLQDQQELMNENEDLRREVEELRSSSPGVDTSRQRNITLERQVMELQSTLSSNEVALVEATTFRQNLDRNNRELIEQIEAAKRKHEEDQEVIASLEARLDESSLGVLGLDKELQDSEKPEAKPDNDLKEKNERLTRASTISEAQYQALQQLFDEQKEKYTDLEKRYFETYKAKLALEETLQSSSLEGTELYRETKKLLDERKIEVSELENEKAALRHKFTEIEKTIDLVDKDKLEALEQLKELNSSELREQFTKTATLENKVKSLTTELDEHRKMLSQTLMSKSQIEGIEPSEDRRKEISEATERQFREMIEEGSKLREDMIKKEQKIQDRDQEIGDLRALLQQEKDRSAPELLKASAQAAMKQELENTRRENKLMSTAYFDLSSRLQMNNVSLQRRTETPRSFLNKQRALVNQATAVRSRRCKEPQRKDDSLSGAS